MKAQVILTEEQMSDFSFIMQNKFPFIYRKNTMYNAELVSHWVVSFDSDNEQTKQVLESVTRKTISL